MDSDPANVDPKDLIPRLLGDRVPGLRTQVQLQPSLQSAGLYDACVRGSDRTFKLYDFEVSIARMLNGRRTASELIEAAGRIGIPVSLDSLGKFIRQLHAYGFVAPPGAPPGEEEGPWTPRSEWKPEVRELFQSALRTFRMDRAAEAREYLEALLQIEPEVPEAIALLTRIEERLAGETPELPAPTFTELHTPEASVVAFVPPGLAAADEEPFEIPPPNAPPEPAALTWRGLPAAEDSLGTFAPVAADAPKPAAAQSPLDSPAPIAADAPAWPKPKAAPDVPHASAAVESAVQMLQRLPPPEAAAAAATAPLTPNTTSPNDEAGRAPADLSAGPQLSGAAAASPPPPSGGSPAVEPSPSFRSTDTPSLPPRRITAAILLPPPEEPLPDIRRPSPRPRWPAFAAGTVIAALLAVLGVPVPFSVSGAVELDAAARAPVTSPIEGHVVELLAEPGAWLEKGAPVARIEPLDLTANVTAAREELTALEQRRQSALRKADSPQARRQKAALEKLQSERARLQAQRDRLARDPRNRRRLQGVIRSLAKKSAEVIKAERAWESSAGIANREALEKRQEAVAGRLAEWEAAQEEGIARASAAGRFTPSQGVGDLVEAGSPLGEMVDARRLHGTVAVSPGQAARVTAGQPLTLRLSQEGLGPVATTVTRMADAPGAGGLWYAELELENEDGRIALPTSGAAEIHCDRTPLLSHLLAVLGM